MRGLSTLLRSGIFILAFALCARQGSAELTVLVGEPFGSFGSAAPFGHSAVYLDRVCADGPTRLRMCQPGESQGVVLARYYHAGKPDWIATPVLQFLYATDRADKIPAYATPEVLETMREQYRQHYLLSVVPDGTENTRMMNEWRENVGVAYIRRLWGYQMPTTREQDERFVATSNARPNRRRYGPFRANCANLSADIVNFYYPHTVSAAKVADLGIMSPKQVAWRVAAYGRRHPEAGVKVIEIAQEPGSLPRSKPVRGGAEGLLKTKRYVIPMAVLQPELVLGLTAGYLDKGRWKIGRNAELAGPESFETETKGTMTSR